MCLFRVQGEARHNRVELSRFHLAQTVFFEQLELDSLVEKNSSTELFIPLLVTKINTIRELRSPSRSIIANRIQVRNTIYVEFFWESWAPSYHGPTLSIFSRWKQASRFTS